MWTFYPSSTCSDSSPQGPLRASQPDLPGGEQGVGLINSELAGIHKRQGGIDGRTVPFAEVVPVLIVDPRPRRDRRDRRAEDHDGSRWRSARGPLEVESETEEQTHEELSDRPQRAAGGHGFQFLGQCLDEPLPARLGNLGLRQG